jgi:hypothetical protein
MENTMKETTEERILSLSDHIREGGYPPPYATLYSPSGQQWNHVYNVVVSKTDDYDVWHGRGGKVSVKIRSESSELYSLNIGFHKGELVVWVQDEGFVEEGDDDRGDLLR